MVNNKTLATYHYIVKVALVTILLLNYHSYAQEGIYTAPGVSIEVYVDSINYPHHLSFAYDGL